MDQIRVFLVDDNDLVRRSLLRLVDTASDLAVVGEAANAWEALARVPVADVDVAVVDVRLPDSSGVEVCRELGDLAPRVRCLMLTSSEEDQALLACVMAGAAGYLVKDLHGRNLLESIRLIATGQPMLSPTMRSRALENVVLAPQHDARLDLLTARERAVLHLIGEGLTNPEIARQMVLDELAVKSDVRTLLAIFGSGDPARTIPVIATRHRPTAVSAAESSP
ncbi:response regulator [Cellulomonas sp. P5_C5]